MFSDQQTVRILMTSLALLPGCGGSGPDDEDSLQRFFSADYAVARSRFRAAAKAAGARLIPLGLEANGPAGEKLTIDIAWFGAEQPRQVLLHSSGLHGVEAFAGSAIQLQWMANGIAPLREDTAVVLVHVMNPYGMAWLRRFNENNVDLNRNFLPPGAPYEGVPDGYDQLNSFLNPASPPSWDFYYARAGWLVLRHGMSTLKQAIARGQYEYPKGLFYGGDALEEGPRKFQQFVKSQLAEVGVWSSWMCILGWALSASIRCCCMKRTRGRHYIAR